MVIFSQPTRQWLRVFLTGPYQGHGRRVLTWIMGVWGSSATHVGVAGRKVAASRCHAGVDDSEKSYLLLVQILKTGDCSQEKYADYPIAAPLE